MQFAGVQILHRTNIAQFNLSFWLEKNRHGGGIAMYILERYAVIVHDNVELFTVTVNNGCCKACISLCFSSQQHAPVCFCGSLCPHLPYIVKS